MPGPRVILIGERDEGKRAHLGIEASFALYNRHARRDMRFEWVRSDALVKRAADEVLAGAGGIWCTPGSPYASTEGALRAIAHARVSRTPFIGTCGGFQHALMEYFATVLKRSAVHQELEPGADSPLISRLSCSLVGAKGKVLAKPGSAYAALMGGLESEEDFNCNYGMAGEYETAFEGSEIEFVARDEAGRVRVFWHRQHPFFVGSLFQPERKAFSGRIHPLVNAFIEQTAGL